MKKFICFMSCICLILCSTACTKEGNKSESATTTSVSSESADNSTNLSAKFKSEDFPLPKYEKNVIYDEKYQVMPTPSSGEKQAFTNDFFYAVLNELENKYVDGLYKLEVVKIYSFEEEKALKGYDPTGIDFSFGIYDCKVLYDYTRNKQMQGQIVTVSLISDNMSLYKGLPSYQIGDYVATALSKPDTGFDYLRSVLYDIEVIEYDGTDVGYVRNIWHEPFFAFDLGLLDGEDSRITTTVNNPAVYYQKVLMTDVAKFCVKDWTENNVFDINASTWIDSLSVTTDQSNIDIDLNSESSPDISSMIDESVSTDKVSPFKKGNFNINSSVKYD